MGIAAIVPVKSLSRAKSRLARELNEGDRAAMTLDMLGTVLRQLRDVEGIAAWGVVSADQDALGLADDLGGAAIIERAGGLNAALDLGRDWAVQSGASALLVLPSDVPLVRSEDLRELLLLGETAAVVIAPSKDGGTNALLLRPPDTIPFRFGRNSATLHRLEAEKCGLSATMFHNGRLAFDVDTPEDLYQYLEVGLGLADKARLTAAR